MSYKTSLWLVGKTTDVSLVVSLFFPPWLIPFHKRPSLEITDGIIGFSLDEMVYFLRPWVFASWST